MIENLKKLIEENDFNGFKKLFSSSVTNAHHKELLYELSYRKQQEDFYMFLENKASLDQEKRINIFTKTILDGVKIKDYATVKRLSDSVLFKDFSKYAEKLIKSQDDDFIIKFTEDKPITSFINFNRLLYGAFKYEKKGFVDFVSKKELTSEAVFYYALCAVNFNQTNYFSTLLKDSLKYNPTILDDIKILKNEYIGKLRSFTSIKKKEDFEQFITLALVETFALYLSEELKKNNIGSDKGKKRLKV